jgi:hypothetical protein
MLSRLELQRFQEKCFGAVVRCVIYADLENHLLGCRMSTESEPMYVDCGAHGKRISAVVCRHLLKPEGERVGFIENSNDPNDLQAWCYKCESVFEEEGGMSERFREFNNMAIVCVVCYQNSKIYHDIEKN